MVRYSLIILFFLIYSLVMLSAIEPTATVNGLAMYRVGEGKPVFLMPYPHASVRVPMAECELAGILLDTGRSVVTFDAPGTFRSDRKPEVTMEEMHGCTLETLDHFGISGPICFAGHSMGSFCALGFALERQARVRELLLIGSTTGWPAVNRWGIHTQIKDDREAYRKLLRLGFWLFVGMGNLEIHKRLERIIDYASFVDKSYAHDIEIERGDLWKRPPVRAKWPRYLRRVNLDYRDRLHEIRVPVLICVGRHDLQTPVVMNRELHDRLHHSVFTVFENSGHSPHIEERDGFTQVVRVFLSGDE